ncbi:hypothetical protein UFOVP352_21 [uncultured Caudovirales phage]|uniref:Holin of 3TMs, for gene-transfer release n=1 Tax=uncultured Caudovirales phage TaxID=2100421 RepID=A0A6J5M7A0_9CAUD|nr:hypothetical protein UFOVP352_21 [uncultured Caudovirales phage]CAB4218775.1 hypothetical protein UFOVP1607_41 [uncultured Caudovirales phage]
MAIPLLLAPLLSQGLSLVANAVIAKGKEWVEDQTGVNLDQPLSAEDTLKLRQFEITHQEELLKLRIEDKKLDLADIDGARQMNSRINESAYSSWLAKNVPAILSLLVVSVGFFLMAITEQPDVRTAVVGLMTLVLGFYFGSSSSSKTKDETIRTLSVN